MASTAFSALGLTFVPNNHSAILSTTGVNSDFHQFQQFLSNSEVGKALTAPDVISLSQVKAFWETGVFSDDGSPTITFTYNNSSHTVTVSMVREALGFGEQTAYTIAVGDSDIRRMLQEIGYDGDTAKPVSYTHLTLPTIYSV